MSDTQQQDTDNPTGRSPRDSRPVVLGCLKPAEFESFLAPNFQDASWAFELVVLESPAGRDAMIAKLNELSSEVLITCWSTPSLPEDLLDRAASLRYVCHLCGTVRRKVPRVLIEKGLIVSGWGDSIARVVAEHSLLQILAALRRIAHWQLHMHTRGEWAKPPYPSPESLFERSVGLHGFGVIARELTRLLAPFDCKITAYSPSVPDSIFTEHGVSRCKNLQELFAENQIIVELAPLKPQNVGMVDETLLGMIQPGGVFVNTGRGAVVDEAALARVAKKGQIHIAVDVYTEEPLPADSPLRGLDNVLLTPHIGGPTSDRRRDCGLYALNNVRAYFADEPVGSQVGVGEWDRQT